MKSSAPGWHPLRRESDLSLNLTKSDRTESVHRLRCQPTGPSIIRLLGLMTALLLSGVASADEPAAVDDEAQHVLVVVGADGTETYGALFREWAERWKSAAATAGADYAAIGLEDQDNDLQQLTQQLSEWTSLQTREPLWLVLLGHGTFDSRVARFNLDGPDLSAQQLSELLSTATRPVAVINCTASSSPFINAVSGPDRVVITATKDGNEMQFAHFGDFLSQAIAGTDADIDRDGQTSLLEAWLFASRRTAEFYEAEGRLATEHSLLDDTADAQGSRAELFTGVRVRDGVQQPENVDGQLARRWHLIRSEQERLLTSAERQRRDDLEQQLEALRQRKTELTEEAYLAELETLLLPLARLYAEVAARSESATDAESPR